jgi:hypothetical protein
LCIARIGQDASGPVGWHPSHRLGDTIRTVARVELTWEAYRAGSLPIGAVVADAEGCLFSAGRNRIHEHTGPPGTVFGRKLAHA